MQARDTQRWLRNKLPKTIVSATGKKKKLGNDGKYHDVKGKGRRKSVHKSESKPKYHLHGIDGQPLWGGPEGGGGSGTAVGHGSVISTKSATLRNGGSGKGKGKGRRKSVHKSESKPKYHLHGIDGQPLWGGPEGGGGNGTAVGHGSLISTKSATLQAESYGDVKITGHQDLDDEVRRAANLRKAATEKLRKGLNS